MASALTSRDEPKQAEYAGGKHALSGPPALDSCACYFDLRIHQHHLDLVPQQLYLHLIPLWFGSYTKLHTIFDDSFG